MATFEKRATTILDEKVNVVLTYRELLYLYASASEVGVTTAAHAFHAITDEIYSDYERIVLTDEIGEFLSDIGPYFNRGNAQ